MAQPDPVRVANRIYHGLSEPDEDNGRPIVAEIGGGGPTERERADRLYQLSNANPRNRNFWWGYGGSNPHDVARALLKDALDVDAPSELVRAFVQDFVAHWPEEGEWWLPRRTLLRWVKGWCVEHGIDMPPGADYLKP